MPKRKGIYSFLIKCFLFIFRLGADILKRDSGDSEDDYNDVDWTLYPDKRGKPSYKLTTLTEDISFSPRFYKNTVKVKQPNSLIYQDDCSTINDTKYHITKQTNKI